jgi:hypothetical protein
MRKFPFGLFLIIAVATLFLSWAQTSWIALINLGTTLVISAAIYVSTLLLRHVYDILIRLTYKNFRGRDDLPELLYRYWSVWTVFWRLSFFIGSGLWVVSVANIIYSKVVSTGADSWLAPPIVSFQMFVVSSLSYFFIVSKAWRVESELLTLRGFLHGKTEN